MSFAARRIARQIGIVNETRRRAERRRPPRAEPLEGRNLLTSMHPVSQPARTAALIQQFGRRPEPDVPTLQKVLIPPRFISRPPINFPAPNPLPRPFPELVPIVPRQGPLVQKTFDGGVVKHPEFYRAYTGPNLDELNAVQATARLVKGVGFVFTGVVLGPINPQGTVHYIFGVNRGGAKAPGPIPYRPLIAFDAAVDVTTGPGGPSGAVTLYDASLPTLTYRVPATENIPIQQGTLFQVLGPPPMTPISVTTLPPGNVAVVGNKVVAVVPFELLPPTGHPLNRFFLDNYAFNFSPQLQPLVPNQIASIVPEYNGAPITVPTSPEKPPHLPFSPHAHDPVNG